MKVVYKVMHTNQLSAAVVELLQYKQTIRKHLAGNDNINTYIHRVRKKKEPIVF